MLGLAALARLTHRLGDRAASGADLAHAARLHRRRCDRRRRRGSASALRFLGPTARRRGFLLRPRRGRGLLLLLLGERLGLGFALALLARLSLATAFRGDALS